MYPRTLPKTRRAIQRTNLTPLVATIGMFTVNAAWGAARIHIPIRLVGQLVLACYGDRRQVSSWIDVKKAAV